MRNFRRRYEDKRTKLIKYFTIFIVVSVPLFFIYSSFSNLRPSGEIKKEEVEMGDRPIEKELNVIVKAEGGLNLRKDPDGKSEKIGKIPDGTKLVVKKELDGWYMVNYDKKDGWISKEYAVIEEAKKEENQEFKDYPEFTGTNYGFKARYPLTWSVQDYGEITAGENMVAFSFSQLPATLPQGGVFFVPIDIRISAKTKEELEAPYANLADKAVTEIDVLGTKGVKYVYTDLADSTEKSKVFFVFNGKAFVVSENGGYQTELEQILKTLTKL